MRFGSSSFAGTGGGSLTALMSASVALLGSQMTHASHFRAIGNLWVVERDNGSGTVDLPGGSPWTSAVGQHLVMGDGLPPGAKIEWDARISKISNVNHQPPPSGSFGGGIDSFSATLDLYGHGTGGSMASFARTLHMPVQVELHNAPRTPGDPVQSFHTEMVVMAGQLPPGDRDFDVLQITAGSAFGMPSPGHTTLTKLPDGDWVVDSFFEITYRIDFVGSSGGPLAGMSGSTTSDVPMRLENAAGELAVTQPNPLGTANTPADGIPAENWAGAEIPLLDGIPAGSSAKLRFREWHNLGTDSVALGGQLNGLMYQGHGDISMVIQATVAGLDVERFLQFSQVLEMHTGPFDPASPVDEFETMLVQLQGQLPPGDPDFDLLRITAGANFGLPSPGHTTLTRMPSGQWAVDSFFEITYQIDYVGAAGGPFDGMSGSSTGTIRMTQGGPLPVYSRNGFGLPHSRLGSAHPVIDDSGVHITGIGSSGSDGVSISLGTEHGTGVAEHAGLQGWTGEVDFGPSGALPPGARTGVKVRVLTDSGQYSVGPSLRIQETDGGQALLAMDPCDPGATCKCGPNCQPWCCPTQPAIAVQLRREGAIVASQTYPPPYPPELVRGPLGLVDGAPPVLISTTARDIDGDGGLDLLQFVFSERVVVPMRLFGAPASVGADTIVVSIQIPGLPWYPAFTHVDITAANMPGGILHLYDEAVIHREYVVQYQESDLDFLMAGAGDVDGDGMPDLLVTNLDSSGDDGVQISPHQVSWDSLHFSSMGAEIRVLDTLDGSLPPNSQLTASMLQLEIPAGLYSMTTSRIARCTSGTCDSVEVHVDFSEIGATSMRCELYSKGTLVASSSGVTGTLAATADASFAASFVGKQLSHEPGSKTEIVTWSFQPTAITLNGDPGGPYDCDELRANPEDPTIIPTEIVSMELTGSNICNLAILDVQATPAPKAPPCPADIAPTPPVGATGDGTVNVLDLLAVIGGWGPCPAPCPPNCTADINDDCTVDVLDLLATIGTWGPCSTQ